MSHLPTPSRSRHDDPPWPEDPPWRHDAGDPDEAFPVPFTPLDALAMVLWGSIFAPAIMGGLAAALGLLPESSAEAPVPALAVQIAIQTLTLLGILGYLALRRSLTWRVLGPVRPRATHVAMGVGLGLVGLLLVVTVSEMVNRSFGPYPAPEQFALQVSTSSALALALAAVAAVVLAPIVEELVFRSLVFQSVRGRLGLWAALVTSSLMFAFVHTELLFRVVDDALVWAPNPPGLVGLVALALWLAGAFHRTGSLLVPVTAHATYNLAVLLIQVVVGVESV